MIKINTEKAKEIAHEIRRADRAEKMKPLDVEVTIPMFAEAAEARRQEIRDENAEIQAAIDAAKSADELKQIVTTYNLV